MLLTACATVTLQGCQSTPPPAAPAVAAYTGPTLSIEQSARGVQIFLPSAALFETGKSELHASVAGPYIGRVAQLLSSKTNHNVLLEGHTDDVGSAALNQALSEARARTVRDALAKQGIPAERLDTVGYAYNRPVASNATEDGRRLNRRVEVIILDEKVENITQGEPANAFDSAWSKLKQMVDQGLVKPVPTP
jgi:outer membrane protein OmpA-like peptidoglycan-associated protein